MKKVPVFITKNGRKIPMNIGRFGHTTGVAVADMNREEHGDYKEVAWLPNEGKMRISENLEPHYKRKLKRLHDAQKNRVKQGTQHYSASQFGYNSKKYKQSLNPKSPYHY